MSLFHFIGEAIEAMFAETPSLQRKPPHEESPAPALASPVPRKPASLAA